MLASLSILTLMYVLIVVTYLKKIVSYIRDENVIEIEEMKKLYARLVEQQDALSKNKQDVASEALKVFTLYDMTKEITKSLNQHDAFEILKEKLHKHVRYVECRFIPEETEEVELYKRDASKVAFKLKSRNKEMGYILIRDINTDDKDKAMILCHQFALALRRVKLYQEIERTAITDSLTDMYTRRYTLQRLDEELRRSRDRKINMSLLMVDADRFKDCNDKYGHLVGDQILREIGQIIKSSIREIDIPGRFGGEEFCIVLPDTDLKGAQFVAERIRFAAEERVIQAYDATPKITVSIGISTFPKDAKKKDELIDKADWSLYKAKKQGRNRVCSFGE